MRRSNPASAGSFSLNLHVVLAALLTFTLAACGHKNSVDAVAVAATPPTVVTQPSSATINAGATATFTVTADAAGSPLTYQ